MGLFYWSLSVARNIDWASIEREYRTGVKSNIQIANDNGVTETAIRKKAKQFGWVKDLSAIIRAKAAEKVRAQEVRTEFGEDSEQAIEQQVIEENATLQANVIREHRKDITKARSIATLLMQELEIATLNPDELEKFAEIRATVGSAEEGDAEVNERLLAFYTKIMELPNKAGVIDKLANALNRLIMLERLAFGISDDVTKSDAPTMSEEDIDRKIAELSAELNGQKG